MSDLIGRTLGPYQILEQLGVGGMATVYKAYHPAMDRYVAIKILPRHMAGDENFRARFQREARTIARLEHRSILPVHDTGEQDGIHYLVMRYTDSGTLSDLIARRTLLFDRAALLVAQVAEALDYAHKQGIVHRDIKPANILISRDGDALLSDFGIARILEGSVALTSDGMLIGTPHYMAPEQVAGRPSDARTDIYALGVVLYEALTGRRPYEAETPLAVALMHIHNPLPPPRTLRPDIPESLERIILRAMAKEPQDRFQTAGEMAAALRAIHTGILSHVAAPATVLLASPMATTQQEQPLGAPTTKVVPRPRPVWLFPAIGVGIILLIGVLALAFRPGAAGPDTGLPGQTQEPTGGQTGEPSGAQPTEASTTTGQAPAARSDIEIYSNTDFVTGLVPDGNGVWAATTGGLVHWSADFEPTVYTLANGLPFIGIRAMVEDQDGGLWLAGERGLARAETDNAALMQVDSYTIDEMGIDYVTAMAVDQDDNLLAIGYTESGLVRYNGGSWSPVIPALNPSVHGDLSGDAASLLVDSDGAIWLGIEHGLMKFSDGAWTRYDTDRGIGDTAIVALAKGEDGQLFAASGDKGLLRYNRDTDTWEHIQVGDGQPIFTVAVLPENNIVAGSWDVVYRSRDGGSTWEAVASMDRSQIGYLPTAYARDDSGAVWVGAFPGLSRYAETRWTSYEREGQLLSTSYRHLFPVNGLFWLIGTNGPITSFNPADGAIGALEDERSGYALAFTPDTTWVGLYDGLYRLRGDSGQRFTTANGLPHDTIYALLATDTTLWIGTGSGLAQLDLASGNITAVSEFDGAPISAIYQAPDGTVWAGSEQNDTGNEPIILGKYDGSNWELWQAGEGPVPATSTYDGITTIEMDSSDRIWVATRQNGLWMLEGDTWARQTAQDGGPPSSVIGIAASDDAVWFVGDFTSIYRYDANGWSTKDIDGLPRVLQDIYVAEDGSLWIVMDGGLIHVIE